MKCKEARHLLALHVKGDLAGRKARKLVVHLEDCRDCTRELTVLRDALSTAADIARAGQPEPLPADFAERVARAARTHSRRDERPALRDRLRIHTGLRLAFGAAALLVVIGVWALFRTGGDPEMLTDTDTPSVPAEQGSEATWSDLTESFSGCLEGPYRLDTWKAPSEAGVFAVMHKPDPERKPDTYVIDYCGEGEKLSAGRGYPWIQQRVRRLVARVGSLEGLYVVVCVMSDSDRRDRRYLTETLIKSYKPFFNQREGV